MQHLVCILAGFTFHYSNACTHHKDKYTGCFPIALALLMATLLILPHRWKEHDLSGVHAGTHLSGAESGAQGCSALSAATVLHSRIHICGIIIEDKYYRVQSERVLCICAGAKKLWNWTLSWSLTTAELSWKQRNHILPQASGDTQVKGQGREWRHFHN